MKKFRIGGVLFILMLPILLYGKLPSTFPQENRPPNDLNERWNFISYIPEEAKNIIPSERPLGSGLWADKAWTITTGDFHVLIAVLDSGIKWDEQDLVRKFYLNAGELPPPIFDSDTYNERKSSLWYCSDFTVSTGAKIGTDYDLNGDGIFNIEDYCADPRVSETDGDDPADNILDPSDLIYAFSNGIDDDGNGYVDDISGWDMFWNDNDPYDDTRYSHGTGEAKDSGAEGDNGIGGIGTCPDCAIIPVRVSDSFIADVNNFAEGIVFAVDHGAKVIQEALGSINFNSFAQDAIDYAYKNGTVVVASAADEDSYHHNYPASGERTLHVNAIRYNANTIEDSITFFGFANCTNYGVKTMVSAPSTSCSSGATGMLSGVVGLIYSIAYQENLDPPLSAEEVMQIVKMSADDIYQPYSINSKLWYPHYKGWDRFTGFGRVNAYKAVLMVKEGRIPPEVSITHPLWWEVIDPEVVPTLSIKGYINARRANSFSYTVKYGIGLDPQDFKVIKEESGLTSPVDGEIVKLDLRKVGIDYESNLRQDGFTLEEIWEKTNKFAVTIVIEVTDDKGNVGISRKTFYIHHDKDLLPGFPMYFGSSGDAALNMADIDNDGKMEIVMALSDGTINVLKPDGSNIPGFPVSVKNLEGLDYDSPVTKQHLNSKAYKSGALNPRYKESILGSPAIGDIDGDGYKEIVVATLDGDVFAFDHTGELLDGFPVSIDPEHYKHTDPLEVLDHGFITSPVLADIDGDGYLEIIAAAMDSWLYVWRFDGSSVSGFPIQMVDKSYSDPTVCIPGSYVNYNDGQTHPEKCIEHGAPMRIIATPAVGDINGDGYLEIVVATGESYAKGQPPNENYIYNSRAYAVNRYGEILPGWPVKPATLNVLPYIGRGISNSPVIADFDGDGISDVAILGTGAGMLPAFIYNGNGQEIWHVRSMTWDPTYPGVGHPPSVVLLNNPTIADLNGDGTPDLIDGGISYEILPRLALGATRVDADHQVIAWDGKTGKILPYFPKIIEDWQFFGNYTVADIDGDGSPELLAGSGGNLVHAYKTTSWKEVTGWPKFVGQWIITAPAVGDIDGDGYLEVAVNTRKGFLYVWKTGGVASRDGKSTVQWQSFAHDEMNTNNFNTPLPVQPAPKYTEEEESQGCSCRVGSNGGGNLANIIFSLILIVGSGFILRKKYV